MRSSADDRLTPRERLTRGLKYSTVGPVDVTRGVVGLGAHSVQGSVAAIRRRYGSGRLREDLITAQEALAAELIAAQEVVANFPEAFQSARRKRSRRKPLLLAGVGIATIAAGGVAFSIIRRSMQPEPSPRPPSVEIDPKP